MLKNGMDRRSLIRAASYAVLTAPLLTLTACLWRKFATYRYRLTLNITKDGKIYSGSSVVEVEQGVQQSIDEGEMGWVNVKGEATFVDLGKDHIVLGLLTGDRPWNSEPSLVLADRYGVRTDIDPVGSYLDELSQKRGVRSLSPEQMPTIITFNDVNDPASYVSVNPTDPGLTLGAAVTNISATIEITDAPVTRGLRKRLKWLGRVHDSLKGNQPATFYVDADQLIQGL